MHILVDILHPKQAHFFRPLIAHWQGRGDRVTIFTRDKDITHQLLDEFGFKYTCLSRQRRGIGLGLELLQRLARTWSIMRRDRPDIAISMVGMNTALPARLLGIPNIAITDTETARLQNGIGLPFADRILTPEWFTRDLGPRQHRYHSFHEWSYLDPEVFTPDPSVIEQAGIDPQRPYAVVRFVAWGAAHDWGEQGFSADQRIALVKGLARHMQVVVTSESSPLPELRPYLASIPVEQMHHLLAFARLVVGESPTMAAEANLLGVSAVLASSWAGECGNMQVLEQRFRLMQVYDRGDKALQAALKLAQALPSEAAIHARRRKLVEQLEAIPQVMDRHIDALLAKPGIRDD